MTCTSSTTLRRRRFAVAVLALPLTLAMTGTAFATGSTTTEPRVASAGGSSQAAPDKPAAAKPDSKPTTTGSAAGAASGKSAAAATETNTTYVNGNTNSSKAERPNAPVTRSAAPSQPLSTADKNGTGANPGSTCTHAYCSNNTGVEPGNGNDSAPAKGQPCAGCVGKADNKNPQGQAPNGGDDNAGYECDRNQGIGKMNPAHTGCTTSTPTTPPTTPPFDQCPNLPGNQPAGTPCDGGSNPGDGTATITVTVDCRTVTVVSSKDISNVVVVFADGTSVKFDGLSGKTWTRTFSKDVRSATAKSATTRVTGTSTGCSGTSPGTPPTVTCPDGSAMPPSGDVKDCKKDDKGGNRGGDKITICHATGSATNPFVVLTIDRNGLNGHDKHDGDIIPMPAGGCPGGTGGGGATSPGQITICHATGSATNPYVVLTISTNGLNGHDKHDGDIIPMPAGGCPTAPIGGGGGGPLVDVCPDVPGMQTMAPCTTNGGGGGTPTTPGAGLPVGGVTPGQPATNPTVPGAANPPAAGAPIGGVTPGLPATNPVPMGPPTVVQPDTALAPAVLGPVTSPAAGPAAARPRALPFTGTDAALLIELGVLLLLAGGGVAVAARRERTARVG